MMIKNIYRRRHNNIIIVINIKILFYAALGRCPSGRYIVLLDEKKPPITCPLSSLHYNGMTTTTAIIIIIIIIYFRITLVLV